jgi:signal transduction histidine kinase
MEIDFQSHRFLSSVPPDISLCLFRVLQESLHNSAKHSRVRHVQVRLLRMPGQIELTVRDCGVGFDSEAAKKSQGLGLVSMQERLKFLKGKLSIESRLRCGTTIRARVPFVPKSDSMRIAG